MAVKREEVQEMEMFGGSAGRKDDEVVMTPNPLKTQLHDLTFQHALKANTTAADPQQQPPAAVAAPPADSPALTSLRAQQAAHRLQAIAQLQSDNSRMSAEMDELTALLSSAPPPQQQRRNLGGAGGSAAFTTGASAGRKDDGRMDESKESIDAAAAAAAAAGPS